MNLSFENHCVSNSPSKIDQWSKPRPAAKLVLLLARRSPLMLKERVGGSMKTLTLTYNNDYQPILYHHTPPPFGHLLFQRQWAAPQYNLSKLSSTFGLHHWSILEEELSLDFAF